MKRKTCFTLIAWFLFLSNIGCCEGCNGHRYFRHHSLHHLVAVVLKQMTSESVARCFEVCYNLPECTGMAVVPMNDTMNCVILNTDVETIDATYTHLPTPLAKIPNFTFYIYTKRQGKVGIIQRSTQYPVWDASKWSTLNDYLTHGRLTGIRVWFGVVSQARFIHGIQIQYNGNWTSVHGESIGTRGEVLLGDGETIMSVRYMADVMRTTGVEFTTSKETTFGPFGWIYGNGTTIQTRALLWLSGGVSVLWTTGGNTYTVIRPIFFYYI